MKVLVSGYGVWFPLGILPFSSCKLKKVVNIIITKPQDKRSVLKIIHYCLGDCNTAGRKCVSISLWNRLDNPK